MKTIAMLQFQLTVLLVSYREKYLNSKIKRKKSNYIFNLVSLWNTFSF